MRNIRKVFGTGFSHGAWFCFLIAGVAQAAEKVPLSIFHTNDLHSHMHSPKSDEFKLGGLARLSTLLNDLRARTEHSITVDAGDWSEGSWLYSLDTGANMLGLLNMMSFDATVVGNHDYFCGPDQLERTVERASPRTRVLAANLDFVDYSGESRFRQKIAPVAVFEKDGIKIGIIGLTYSGILYSKFLKPIKATKPIDEAIKQAKWMRKQVDILIVLSHNEFSYNKKLAAKVPGIDAVISGHSHKKVSRAVMVKNGNRNIPVVETGSWGTFLGEVRFMVDRDSHSATYASYELHPVMSSLIEDKAVAAQIAREDERLAALFGGNPNDVIGETEIDLDRSDTHHASLSDVAAKSLRAGASAEVGLEAMMLTGVKIPHGPITVMDAHDVLPHMLDIGTGKEWTIKVWNALGSDLWLIAQLLYLSNIVSLQKFGLESTGFMAFDNLEVTWMPKHGIIGIPRVREISIGGKPLEKERRYSVALTDGVLMAIAALNEKLHIGIDVTQMYDTGLEAWRAVAQFVEKNKKLTANLLREGSRSFTTIADPAVFHYGVNYDGSALVVEVSNEGLAPAKEVKLECVAGLVDNLIVFGTDEQVFSVIGRVDVPTIAPSERVSVKIPWAPLGGAWPVKCSILSQWNGYTGNDIARRLLRL